MSEHKIRNGKTWNTKSVMANPEHEIRKRDLRDHVIGIIKHGTPNPEGQSQNWKWQENIKHVQMTRVPADVKMTRKYKTCGNDNILSQHITQHVTILM